MCEKCGAGAHRDDAMNRRCNSCEKLVRLCDCTPKNQDDVGMYADDQAQRGHVYYGVPGPEVKRYSGELYD